MDKHRDQHKVDNKEQRIADECSDPSNPASLKGSLANPILSLRNLSAMAIPLQKIKARFKSGAVQGGDDPGVLESNDEGVVEAGDEAEVVKPLPSWRFALLGLGLSLGLFMAMLDTSIVATCLYSIAIDFDTMESINWVALAYTLAYIGCAVLFARVSDVIGRKAAVLVAFFVFVVFSIACGFAQTLIQLIVFRALQGIGGSGLYSLSIIIFPELTPAEKKKYIAMIIGLVIAVSGVLGPVIGGLLTQYRTWRWVFWINGPIGVFSAAVFWLSWPTQEYLPNIERHKWKDLDYVGSFLLIAASVLIVFAFQSAGYDGTHWGDATFIAPLVLGIACAACLFSWELFIERRWKGKVAAAIPLVLLRNHVYAAGVLNTMFLGFPYLLCVYTFPLRFQVVYRKSALQAGLMLLPMLASTAMGSVLASPINSSKKKNRLFETLMAACLSMLIGCALQTMATPSATYEPRVLGFLVFIGLGFGLSASASTMLGATEAPFREHAPAQGIIAQLRILGGSIGIAASTAILGVKTRAQLSGVLSPAQLSSLAAQEQSFTPEQYAAVRVAYTDALKEMMKVCCGVLAVALFLTIGVYRRNRVSLDEALRHGSVDG